MAKKKIEKRTEFCKTCKHIGNLYKEDPQGNLFMGVCEIDGFSKILDKHYCDNYKQKKMARPTKNNCDYFPHQTTMRNHRKVKALRNKFGQVLGYAFWAMFIEYLTEQDGCEVENSEIELDMFAGELGVSVTEIQEMVNYCIRIELLFLNKDNFIYSESLNDNLLPVFEKRKKAKEMSKTRKKEREWNIYSRKNHSSRSYCSRNSTE